MSGGGSPTPITDFLFRLEVDPELVRQFVEDPDHALAGSGLPDEAVEAFREGDLPKLQELVDLEHPDEVHLLIKGWIRGWVRAPGS